MQTEEPNDLDIKKIANPKSLPPKINLNKGNNQVKLKIRTKSSEDNPQRSQSAQSQLSGQSISSKKSKLTIKTKSSGRNSASSRLSNMSKGSNADSQ